ncbi:MAG: sigma 54-interacting transcriptional regulator [Desulfobacterales bacterium]
MEHYWKIVVDTIQDGVMIVNERGVVEFVNRAFEEMTGYAKQEIVGQSCHMCNCSNCEIVRKTGNRHWCAVFEKGYLRKQKCLLVRKDGRTVDVVKNACVLKDADGNIVGAVETLTNVSDLTQKEIQIELYRRELNAADRFHDMVGISPSVRKIFDLIRNAAQSDAPVIIYGESGTGKEMVARAIHEESQRRKKPYIKVNCAALNDSLLESELFGHVKGAYTGAHCDRQGRFEAAHHGSIFLDEIGELPMSNQVKLLRVLEEGVVERVGDHRQIKANVRIISATNRNLLHLMSQGKFRTDFFYRINVIPIQVPPLRERTEDIPLLARSFFNLILIKSAKQIQGISSTAMDLLMQYRWPGNVRELRSAMEFAFVTTSPGGIIGPENLPQNILARAPWVPPKLSLSPSLSLNTLKKQRLIKALQSTGGNQSEAARRLGLSRTSVWNQLRKYDITPADFRNKS